MLGTGDLGHVDADGLLHVNGRADDMMVSGGENVFPRPVEELLAKLPQVREVAVIGVPDPEFGERLAAYLVLHPGRELDADEVREYVRHYLARFSVPRDVRLPQRELPRTATGKVHPPAIGSRQRLARMSRRQCDPAVSSVYPCHERICGCPGLVQVSSGRGRAEDPATGGDATRRHWPTAVPACISPRPRP